jgi:hypothetical protein
MVVIRRSPGPAADHAFRLGIIAAAIIGLAAIGLLYWTGSVSSIITGYVVVTLYPVYLIFAAVVLSVWLGYDKDATALRPVTREETSD